MLLKLDPWNLKLGLQSWLLNREGGPISWMTSNTLSFYVESGEEEVTYEAMECSRSLHYALVQHYLLRTEHYLSRREAFFLFYQQAADYTS